MSETSRSRARTWPYHFIGAIRNECNPTFYRGGDDSGRGSMPLLLALGRRARDTRAPVSNRWLESSMHQGDTLGLTTSRGCAA